MGAAFLSKAGEQAVLEMPNIVINYNTEASSSLLGGSAYSATPALGLGLKVGVDSTEKAGSGSARSHREIVELSGEVPKHISYLFSPPSTLLRKGHDEGLAKGKGLSNEEKRACPPLLQLIWS
ncbi:hypothetical protein PanWU01x14_343550 [Parasponia andersonii]|uniref:Uncharacterized protein n=1 Tax=Parasponia andersonii TaxID=3476 RepID=A0A2P5ADB0_PARAD|nr:hypothetical protein PanWU01x14_343550 [Parasponia andersonii]